jgi:hypothetical protein
MKIIKTGAIKVMILISIFCSAAFADGEMGGGGLAEPGTNNGTVKTVVTSTTNDTGSSYIESVIASIFEYIDRMI